MPEYIEREAVLTEINSVIKDYADEHTFATDFAAAVVCELRDNVVAIAPAADVEKVVRCKDCYQSCYVSGMFGESLFCTYWNKDTDENGYCHEGG